MKDFYGTRYKKLLIIPAILLIIFLFLILIYPGINRGIDLTGGTVIIVRSDKELSRAQIESVIKSEFDLVELRVSTISSPTGYGAWIQYSKNPVASDAEVLIASAEASIGDENTSDDSQSIAFSNQAIKRLGGNEQEFKNAKLALLAAQQALASYKEEFSKKMQAALSEKLSLGQNVDFQQREVSATLGNASYESGILVAVWGIILVFIVIFLFFREIVPSIAVMQAALFDIIAAMAGMAFFGIPFSLVSISALLMLIGYSVDTDIMLTHRVLKRKEKTPSERAAEALGTGLTMTGTTLAALGVMIVISFFYQIEVIYQITVVLFVGLLGDLVSTWITNVSILLLFLERKKAKAAGDGSK
jgi:preprotein translocase subunit SecF